MQFEACLQYVMRLKKTHSDECKTLNMYSASLALSQTNEHLIDSVL